MYLKRLIESEIVLGLKTSGAILVSGPKYCGKSTTCALFAKSSIALDTDEIIQLVQIDPRIALEGAVPHLIDEWQEVTDIWNHVKSICSKQGDFGMFILTGSATPPDQQGIHHSGAGRIAPIIMRPCSLYESLESKGTVSLMGLFDNPDYDVHDLNDERTLYEAAHEIVRGGWPQSLKAEPGLSDQVTRNYYNGLFNFHDSNNPEFRKLNPGILIALLKSYARHVSSEATNATLMKDVKANGRATFDDETFTRYSSALKDLFIVYDMDSWNPNLRSKIAVQSIPVRHFYDPSLACMALGISEEDLLRDPNTMGLFFKDLACRDISIYSMAKEGKISHYRDSTNLECDIVLHLNDGRWAAIEVKLGGEKLVQEGITNLKKFRNRVDTQKENKPSFLMVLTAKGPAYKSEDGVYVVPINLLKP